MCLFVRDEDYPQIAEKDIICWKKVINGYNYWKPFYHYRDRFLLNKIETALDADGEEIKHLKIVKRVWSNTCTISYGFHASIKYRIGDNICIIPKNTEYCLGDNNEIVAVNIIVFRTIFSYLFYKLKQYSKTGKRY